MHKHFSLLYTFAKPEHADEFREHCRKYNLNLVEGRSQEAKLYQVDVRWFHDPERPITWLLKMITESRFFTQERHSRGIFAHRELRNLTLEPEAKAAPTGTTQSTHVSYRRG